MKHNALFFACLSLTLMVGCSSKNKTPFGDVAADSSELIPPALPAQVVETQIPTPLPQQASIPTTLPTSTLAIYVDEKGNLTRGFSVSTLPSVSGDIIAGPTYWPDLNLSPKRSDLENFLFEPFEFVLSSAMLPVRAVVTAPWKRVIYTPVPTDDATPASAYDRQIITTERLEK